MPKRRRNRQPNSLSTKQLEGDSTLRYSSSLFKLVPDVLGLIALQMDQPADFASFSLTCSAWYQATVDNAHLLQSKIYRRNINVEVAEWHHESRDLQKLVEKLVLLYNQEPTEYGVQRTHGSKLRQIKVCWARVFGQNIIIETAEGYWIELWLREPESTMYTRWAIGLYSPELQCLAEIGPWSQQYISFRSREECICVRYPVASKTNNKNGGVEERFRTWTSVKDFETYFHEALRSIPSDVPLSVDITCTHAGALRGRLFESWLACLGTDRPTAD